MTDPQDSMATSLLDQMRRESGLHTSRSDQNEHLSIKNQDGVVVGHAYPDGVVKGTNQGGSGALSWLQE